MVASIVQAMSMWGWQAALVSAEVAHEMACAVRGRVP
jgi:hypothetical protein